MSPANKHEFTPLSRLTLSNHGCRIRVRISRIWMPSNPDNGRVFGLDSLLIDDEGKTMQAHADLKDMKRLEERLVEGRVYVLSGFMVCIRQTNFMTCSNDLMLRIDAQTVLCWMLPLQNADSCIEFMAEISGLIFNAVVKFLFDALAASIFILPWSIDSESMVDLTFNCIRLILTSYAASHTGESEFFRFVCSIAYTLQTDPICLYLTRKYQPHNKIVYVCMAISKAVVISLLCHGMVVPEDDPCQPAVVSAIIVIVLLQAVKLLFSEIKQRGTDEHLLRDLFIKSGETIISPYWC